MSEKQSVRVRDVMQTKFLLVDGLMTVAEAIGQMKARRVSTIVVQKRHEDDEYAIVLLTDIAKKVIAKDRPADRVNLYEIMSKPVISVSPKMNIRYCARLFEQFGLAIAPVLENDVIIGMVNYTSIVFGERIAVTDGD